MKNLHWTELGAFLFLVIITAQLFTLIFWPHIIISEDNKGLVIIEFVCMFAFDVLYFNHVIRTSA